MALELYALTAFAFGAGIATFFAPCSYALLPGYVGYYVASTEGESPPLSGVLARGGAAAVGIFASFFVLSLVAISASDLVERYLPTVELLVGVLLVVLGVLVVSGRTGSFHVPLPERRSTILGFGLFGAIYAVAAAACVLPLFLAVALQSLTLPPSGTVLVLGAYAGSVGVLMVVTTIATAVGHDALTDRIVGNIETITRLAGVVLVLAGLGQIYVVLGL